MPEQPEGTQGTVSETWHAICLTCDRLYAEPPSEEQAEAYAQQHLSRQPKHNVIVRRTIREDRRVATAVRMLVWALGPCKHLSSAGYREAVAEVEPGVYELKDGCRVSGVPR